MMKQIFLTMGLLLPVGLASAQSLGDVARKEKERRQANAEAGRAAVVTANGTGEVGVHEPETPGERGRVADLERELREANEKLDELLERTPPDAPEEEVEVAEPRPPTARERADEYQRQMLELRQEYSAVLSRCLGGSWTNVYGELIGTTGDTAACYEAEMMRAEYGDLYQKIWAIEGSSILRRDLPKRLDPNRA